MGKTHLLHSIGNYVRTAGDGLNVRYTTVETFTNQFIAAINSRSVDRFKGRFRRNDVLLIDDVQFLASKVKTEEEFFHTFNALYEAGSQLVLTCDRLPRDLEALEDRLRERFESGLVTAITAPDLPTRLTVLRKRVQHDGIDLDDEQVLTLIAERVPTNVRALEGALIRVVAYASLTGRPLDADSPPRSWATCTRRGRRPGRGAPPADDRPHRPPRRRRLRLQRGGDPLPRPPPRARLRRARSPCTSRASTRARPCPRSAGASAAATTRPSCTPAGAPPSAWPPIPSCSRPFGA